MHSQFTWKIGLFIFLLLQPSALLGQPVQNGPQPRPNVPAVNPTPDAREQRAARERAVAAVGATGRDFVETYGEDAVAAIFACSQPVASQLVEFHSSGGLGKLSRPREVLRVIGYPKHGDEVASWAIAHADALKDADQCDAYLLNPLAYALALKKLGDGATEVREIRRYVNEYKAQRAEWASRSSYGWRMFGLGGGVTAVVLLVAWRLHQRRAQNAVGA
jgi:hypothetical protein